MYYTHRVVLARHDRACTRVPHHNQTSRSNSRLIARLTCHPVVQARVGKLGCRCLGRQGYHSSRCTGRGGSRLAVSQGQTGDSPEHESSKTQEKSGSCQTSSTRRCRNLARKTADQFPATSGFGIRPALSDVMRAALSVLTTR
jgi:hypothetical protein